MVTLQHTLLVFIQTSRVKYSKWRCEKFNILLIEYSVNVYLNLWGSFGLETGVNKYNNRAVGAFLRQLKQVGSGWVH